MAKVELVQSFRSLSQSAALIIFRHCPRRARRRALPSPLAASQPTLRRRSVVVESLPPLEPRGGGHLRRKETKGAREQLLRFDARL